jgi:type IV pilus assembly protein PilV
MCLLQTRSVASRPKFRGARHGQRGVALIEALVSVLIFSFGVLGLIGLQARAIDYSVDAEDRDRASILAHEIASSMWLQGSVTVTGAQLTAWQTQAQTPTQSGLTSGNVTVTPTAGTTNSADIVVTWRAQSDPASAPNRQFTTRVVIPQ